MLTFKKSIFRQKLAAVITWLSLKKGRALLRFLAYERLVLSFFKLQWLYQQHLISLIKHSGLFDTSYYLEVNHDVAAQGVPPLLHYIKSGDKEGRCPMPLFDPHYYRAQTTDKLIRINSLLYYIYIGRYLRLPLSPWFDVDYYLRENRDVAYSGVDPLKHYLEWGGIEGRSPCAQFNGLYYLHANDDVLNSGLNPLFHYLRYGRLEGRRTLPDQNYLQFLETKTAGLELLKCSLPDYNAWTKLKSRAKVRNAPIDVIVPVYKGYAETLRCLYSVLSAQNKSAFELVVIDDASTDTELVAELARLAQMNLLTLRVHKKNRGFVETVNHGMLLHLKRDVVLLNSDTEVYDGWLDRLRAAANLGQTRGTVTPLSNNATICSYPRFLHDNPYPLELDYTELNELTGKVNAGIAVAAPTGVGFCMYIKRECLTEVGLFDEATFGKGYGEENDFCQRAIQKNWQNMLAADVFVRHWGSVSFQGEKARRVNEALKIMHKRYPQYQHDIQAFIQQDPLKEARSRLDWARIKRLSKLKNVLIVSHNRGGGSERCVQEHIQRLNAEGCSVFLMRPANEKPTHGLLTHTTIQALLNHQPFALADTDALSVALQELKITTLYIHSLADFAVSAADHFVELVEKLSLTLEIYIHDYKAICPRINLVDNNGHYCGEPDEKECNRCLKERGSIFQVLDIVAWREMRKRLLVKAQRIIVPNQDVALRLQNYFPDIRFSVIPHETIDATILQIRQPVLEATEKLRIIVIGAINKLKGYDILYACAQDAKKRQLPLEFIIMGYSLDDDYLKKVDVQISGRYVDNDADEKLASLQGHIAWYPALWPETYSYTLSIALKNAYPVFAFDIGAIPNRLRAIHVTEGIMPLMLMDTPAEINELFLQYRLQHIQA